MTGKIRARLQQLNLWCYEPTFSLFGVVAIFISTVITDKLNIFAGLAFVICAGIFDRRIHKIHGKYKNRSRALQWQDWNHCYATAPAFGPARYWIHKSERQQGYELSYYVPGWSTPVAEGLRYPTMDAAKATAQADYENKISEALT